MINVYLLIRIDMEMVILEEEKDQWMIYVMEYGFFEKKQKKPQESLVCFPRLTDTVPGRNETPPALYVFRGNNVLCVPRRVI